jgi:two-component system, chemotaxis family, chemotaxis protein CheY
MPSALVVDDSPVMRTQLRALLRQAGCDAIVEGATGDDALPLYERHKPDLVFLDIVMPGKDGVTAATELLTRYPNAVVVMCTSLTTRDKVLACQKAGVSHYLLKPFQADRAIAVMKHLLARNAPAIVSASVAS